MSKNRAFSFSRELELSGLWPFRRASVWKVVESFWKLHVSTLPWDVFPEPVTGTSSLKLQINWTMRLQWFANMNFAFAGFICHSWGLSIPNTILPLSSSQMSTLSIYWSISTLRSTPFYLALLNLAMVYLGLKTSAFVFDNVVCIFQRDDHGNAFHERSAHCRRYSWRGLLFIGHWKLPTTPKQSNDFSIVWLKHS